MTKQRASPIALAIQISKAWGPHFPVNVRQIALELSSRQSDPIVKIDGLDLEGAEGFLARNGVRDCWGIAYSTHIRESGKVNFTIGHELGHYLCHRSAAESAFVCSRDDMVDFAQNDERPTVEQEANAFASYLLMPIADLRRQTEGQRITIALLNHCASRYDTTLAATALKLIEFTEEPVVVMLSSGGKVCWARSSDSALRLGFFFRKHVPVPAASLTARCQSIGTTANSEAGIVVPAPIWTAAGDVFESAIAQPYYKTVFTVLHMTAASQGARTDEDLIEDSFDRLASLTR